MPDCLRVKLTYFDTATLRNNVGAGRMSWRIRTSAYDPDPLLLTGALPGFAELAAMYNAYLVTGVAWNINLVNAETFPVSVVVVPTSLDIGSNYVANDVSDYRYASPARVLGGTGAMNRARIKGYISQKKLFGSKQTTYDSNWYSGTNTNPGLLQYVNVQAASMGPSVFTNNNGIQQNAIWTFYVMFIQPKNLAA